MRNYTFKPAEIYFNWHFFYFLRIKKVGANQPVGINYGLVATKEYVIHLRCENIFPNVVQLV